MAGGGGQLGDLNCALIGNRATYYPWKGGSAGTPQKSQTLAGFFFSSVTRSSLFTLAPPRLLRSYCFSSLTWGQDGAEPEVVVDWPGSRRCETPSGSRTRGSPNRRRETRGRSLTPAHAGHSHSHKFHTSPNTTAKHSPTCRIAHIRSARNTPPDLCRDNSRVENNVVAAVRVHIIRVVRNATGQ